MTESSSRAASEVEGIHGMILAARYAREHNIPYLGICLGMQIVVIEFARHVLGTWSMLAFNLERKSFWNCSMALSRAALIFFLNLGSSLSSKVRCSASYPHLLAHPPGRNKV